MATRGVARHAVRVPGERRRDRARRSWSTSRPVVGRRIEVARLRSRSVEAMVVLTAMASVAGARYLFAGPGPRTYGCASGTGTAMPGDDRREAPEGQLRTRRADVRHRRGSHARRRTFPVYEIYKVGPEPHWLDGLDLLGEVTGLQPSSSPTSTTPRAATTTRVSATSASAGCPDGAFAPRRRVRARRRRAHRAILDLDAGRDSSTAGLLHRSPRARHIVRRVTHRVRRSPLRSGAGAEPVPSSSPARTRRSRQRSRPRPGVTPLLAEAQRLEPPSRPRGRA